MDTVTAAKGLRPFLPIPPTVGHWQNTKGSSATSLCGVETVVWAHSSSCWLAQGAHPGHAEPRDGWMCAPIFPVFRKCSVYHSDEAVTGTEPSTRAQRGASNVAG